MLSDALREATKKKFSVMKLIKVCLAKCKLGYLKPQTITIIVSCKECDDDVFMYHP